MLRILRMMRILNAGMRANILKALNILNIPRDMRGFE
jgi:hypothetical protein